MINTVDLNSQIRFAESIYSALFSDVASGRPSMLRSSLSKDLDTVLRRIRKEGLGFCTIALPSLGKAVVQSFQTGQLSVPSCFSKVPGTSLPKFLQGLMKEIYNEDGTILADYSVPSVTEVRQICEMCYKLKLGYSQEAQDRVITGFVETERELRSLILPETDTLLELATTIISDVLWGFDPLDIIPRHGPGGVATGEKGMAKWTPRRNFESIHQVFSYHRYFYGRGKALHDKKAEYLSLERHRAGCALVRLVEKDSRGPRLISMEPLEYQFIQQGLWRALHSRLRSHPFTQGHVNFEHQTVNQKLAKAGSRTGRWATLDMKDASDRVSLTLVRRLFSGVPHVLRAFEAARSVGTELPNGTCVPLVKFAPMGSALCFPVESLVHYALCVASIINRTGLSRWQARRRVFVYGDDLIVGSRHALGVMEDLETVGLKFNRGKCFLSGPFRESCGVDALNGYETQPIRWRTPCPNAEQRDAASLLALSEFSLLVYQRGYFRLADTLWSHLESIVGKLPTCPLGWDVGYLCRKTHLAHSFYTPHRVRVRKKFQRLEHRAIVIRDEITEVDMCGWSRLDKFFAMCEEPPTPSRSSMFYRVYGREGRPYRITPWQDLIDRFAGASKENSGRSFLIKGQWKAIC